MTVSTTTNRQQYATDWITIAFTIHFPFFEETDVNAIFVNAGGIETVLVLNTDFTVSGGSGAGGTLTAMSPPATGGTLTIYRDIPFTQKDDYVEDDPLPADTLEGGFDRAAMRDQQLQDGLDRALTFPVTISPTVSAELPSPAPDEFLRWNTAGDALESAAITPGASVSAATTLTAGIAELLTEDEFRAAADPDRTATALAAAPTIRAAKLAAFMLSR